VFDHCLHNGLTKPRSFLKFHDVLQSLAAILLQSWWRANIRRRIYLLQQTKRLDSTASSYQSPGGLDAAKQENDSTFFLFDPSAVFLLPDTLVSCFQSVQGMGTVQQAERMHKASSASSLIQQFWRSRNTTQMEAPVPRKLQPTQDPVSRAQALSLLRLIVSNVQRMQCWWRERLSHLCEIKERKTILIQAFFRGVQCRRQVRFQLSVILVQRRYRAVSLRREFLRMRRGMLFVQKRWKIYLSQPQFMARLRLRNKRIGVFQKLIKQQYNRKTQAITKIQRLWRLRRGVLTLQRLARRRFQEKLKAAILLQRTVRLFSAQSYFLRLRLAASHLAANWRGFSPRRLYHTQRSGFIVLQHRVKLSFREKTRATLLLQRHSRMISCKGSYSQKRAASQMLQKQWRGYSARKEYQVGQKKKGLECIIMKLDILLSGDES